MKHKFNLEDIFSEAKSLFGQNLTAAESAEITNQAHALAHDAFAQNEPVARGLAERILYAIHCQSGFLAPLQPKLNLIWHPLIRAKLQSDLKNYVDRPGLSADEMVEMCMSAAEASEKHVHTLIDRCGSIADRTPIRAYTKNWYSSTHGFTHQLITLAVRADNDIKRTIFANLAAEFGEEPHPERRRVWPSALGIDYQPVTAVVDPEQTTEAFGLQNLRTALSCLQDTTFALGSFYSIEAVFIGVSVRLYKVGKKLGFDDKTLYHFKEHAELDPTHALEWLQTVKLLPLTPEQRVNVVNGTFSQLHQRTLMFQAIERMVFNNVTVKNFEAQGFRVYPKSPALKAA